MISITDVDASLVALGERLRERRIEYGLSQEALAQKIGVSAPTIRAMEAGKPATAIGSWANALWMLDRLGDVDAILKSPEVSLFDLAAAKPPKRRQRAPRRRP